MKFQENTVNPNEERPTLEMAEGVNVTGIAFPVKKAGAKSSHAVHLTMNFGAADSGLFTRLPVFFRTGKDTYVSSSENNSKTGQPPRWLWSYNMLRQNSIIEFAEKLCAAADSRPARTVKTVAPESKEDKATTKVK